MADGVAFERYAPYLLGRRLRAVVWPEAGEARAASVVLLVLGLVQGASLGAVLRLLAARGEAAELEQLLWPILRSTLFVVTLLIDFMPAYRPVQPVLPEHYPVSARANALLAFLLDLLTLRRLSILLALLALCAAAPAQAPAAGLTLLLVLSATALSFSLRLLFTLGRWRHPLLLLHLMSVLLLVGWVWRPAGWPAWAATPAAVPGPLLLGALQLWWLGPYFSARYLPTAPPAANRGQGLLNRLSPEWKAYWLKAWPLLMVGLFFKLVMLGFLVVVVRSGKPSSIFFMFFLPIIGFTYANNNLFGQLAPLTLNELRRLGLTTRLLTLYLRITGPVVLVECLLAALAVLVLFPQAYWPLLGLLPLAAGALLAVGLWGSLYRARGIKKLDLTLIRQNTSQLVGVGTMLIGAALYFMPWWWARVLLAAAVIGSAWWPLQRLRRNDGPLRRQLAHALEQA